MRGLKLENISRLETNSSDTIWTVNVPPHRFDLTIEEDLIEEVCRLFGYNNVPAKMPRIKSKLAEIPRTSFTSREFKTRFASMGFFEAITYSFIDPDLHRIFDEQLKPLELSNPMSVEQSVMRTSLIPGLTQACASNVAHQQTSGKLFELGAVFLPKEDGAIQQPVRIASIAWGDRGQQNWHKQDVALDYFDLKGVVDSLGRWSGRQFRYQAGANNYLHPGQSAQVCLDEGTEIGWLGKLHPAIQKKLNLPDCFVFELDFETLSSRVPSVYKEISRFPSVKRDIAILVDKSVSASEVVNLLEEELGKGLRDVRLFDVYEGKGIDSDKKSLALSLTFESQTATLTEEEIVEYSDKSLNALRREFKAELR
jgi:phenylalanyl-tRNA synthetase beta chain